MSVNIWQEIEKLKLEVKRLEQELARQSVLLDNPPIVRIGDIIESDDLNGNRGYRIREITVAAQKTEEHRHVRPIGTDPGPATGQTSVAFYIDSDRERYILPDPNRIILVEDTDGSGSGQHIEKDETGAITVPTGSEVLDLVVAEPTSSFHDGEYPFAEDRIYPGMKIISMADPEVKKYLVFIAGHGGEDKTFEISGVDVNVDYSGKLVSVD